VRPDLGAALLSVEIDLKGTAIGEKVFSSHVVLIHRVTAKRLRTYLLNPMGSNVAVLYQVDARGSQSWCDT
jgi:hypothetical protein